MSIGSWLPVVVALCVCGCRPPEPLEAAEAACHVDIGAAISSGACDGYVSLQDCPEYNSALDRCIVRLDKAEKQESAQ